MVTIKEEKIMDRYEDMKDALFTKDSMNNAVMVSDEFLVDMGIKGREKLIMRINLETIEHREYTIKNKKSQYEFQKGHLENLLDD